ncbi:carboxylating nicotinate-nucleotide diphosphorylase [Novispirillum sp. DQ9]|uniref:carboxylating nicotinate-nucleotide diphosphorylase n=1 Tax=Novispirillum sp. DQ9 TaxID=3398612 RepID=UPI003C7B1D15
MTALSMPHPLLIEPFLREALREDMGRAGDITTDAIAPPGLGCRAEMQLRSPGRVCGVELARQVFAMIDPSVSFTARVEDGATVGPNTTVAVVSGSARAVLTGERVALNLLGRLSGIATLTAACVEKAAPFGTRVACTRKTTPGLRVLEKYAVRVGGGANHRFGLDDGILIKDNHITVAGSITEAVRRAKAAVGHMVKIEVEVDTLDQLEELLRVGADAVLLDNMGPDTLRQAVGLVAGRMTTEASGGITLDNLADIAATGVDLVSLGFLTHGARSLDIGLDFVAD